MAASGSGKKDANPESTIYKEKIIRMENLIYLIFGKVWVMFNVKSGIRAALEVTKAELEMSEAIAEEKRGEMEELIASKEGKDEKEVALLNDDIKQKENEVKVAEAGVERYRLEQRNLERKLRFMRRYARGSQFRFWGAVVAAIAIIYFYL